ncbi:unnamed protein product [Caretta caretta]
MGGPPPAVTAAALGSRGRGWSERVTLSAGGSGGAAAIQAKAGVRSLGSREGPSPNSPRGDPAVQREGWPLVQSVAGLRPAAPPPFRGQQSTLSPLPAGPDARGGGSGGEERVERWSGDVSRTPRPRAGYISAAAHVVGLFRNGFADASQVLIL